MDNSIYGNKSKIAGCYNLGKTIGMGHFAVVKEAQHVFTQEKVAIKIIDKTKLDNEYKDQLLSEVMCMKLVQHPNIVRLYEVIDTPNKLYLVLELGDGGDLYDYILSKGADGLNEHDAKHYFRQILRAVSYCHKLHVVHRDLKPENVVFFKQSELLKLTDFGFSNKFTPGEALKTSCGSLAYSAPEILLGDSYDAPKVDIWSLGVILYMLVVGHLPFNEPNDSETIARIMDCNYVIPDKVSDKCRKLIKKMIVKDFRYRISLDEILSDEWLKLKDDTIEFQLENYTIPLITQNHLELEDHIELLTKMSDGNLAPVDKIQEILDNGIYNHISATYFLLAERKLKRKYVEEYCQLKAKCKCQTFANELLTRSSQTNSDICQKKTSLPQTTTNTTRCISMILEGEESEEDEENDAMTSLALVKQELEMFVPKRDNEHLIESGIAPPNPSRCCSRFNSSSDLGNYNIINLTEDYESDSGTHFHKAPNVRTRRNSSNIRSFNSVSSQCNNNEIEIDMDLYINEFIGIKRKKCLTQIPENFVDIYDQNMYLKKSYSVTDLLGTNRHQNYTNDTNDTDNMPNQKYKLHKFFHRSKSNTQQKSPNSLSYSKLRHSLINEFKFNLMPSVMDTKEPESHPVFDTGSDSSPHQHHTSMTATSSSAESSQSIADGIADIDKSTFQYHHSTRTHKVSTQSWEGHDNPTRPSDIYEPIHEESCGNDFLVSQLDSHSQQYDNNQHTSVGYFGNCTRSKSFDSRYNCLLHGPTTNATTSTQHPNNSFYFHNQFPSKYHNNNNSATQHSIQSTNTSPFKATASWDRISINRQLQKSNNSISSFVMKLQHSNVDQLIRGTFELRKSQNSINPHLFSTNMTSNYSQLFTTGQHNSNQTNYNKQSTKTTHSYPLLSCHSQNHSTQSIQHNKKTIPTTTTFYNNHNHQHHQLPLQKHHHKPKRKIRHSFPKSKFNMLKKSFLSSSSSSTSYNVSYYCPNDNGNDDDDDRIKDCDNFDDIDENDDDKYKACHISPYRNTVDDIDDDDDDNENNRFNKFCFSLNRQNSNTIVSKSRSLSNFRKQNLSCCVIS